MRSPGRSGFALSLALVLAVVEIAGAPPDARPAGVTAGADSIRYATRIADGNLVGATLTNYGFLGNDFVSRAPSLEYPLGSHDEHLVRGGLWVGAAAQSDTGSFIGVTTACVDGTSGTAPQGVTEFTPAGTDLTVRSTLFNSPYYDPAAISEQDVDCWFSDEPAKTFSPENHTPLDLLVHQQTFAWSFSDLAHVLFLRYVVHNQGPTLRHVHVGFYSEFASGFRDDYACWPPASYCSAYGSWFGKEWIQYEDSLRLFREHFCLDQPVPAGCNLPHVPAWIGVRLLGVSPGSLADTSRHVTLAAWNYSPGDPARDQDAERYALMSAGTLQDVSNPGFLPGTGDPVELLAVGPFDEIAPGDSVTVDFALVGGAEIADIEQHARTAQVLRDGDFDITVPVEASLVSAEAGPGVARLRWSIADGAGSRWTVERSRGGADWRAVGAVVPDGTGFALFEDHSVAGGERYGYRLESPDGGVFGEAWVEVPRSCAFALLAVQPNPAGPEGLRVAFSLAEEGPVAIEVFDPSGRRVLVRELGALAPGNHLVSLGRAAGMKPGACFVRLRQGGRSRTLRAVLLE